MKMFDTILVLDFGGQYSHLIARRIREQKVYSEIIPANINKSSFLELKKKFSIKGLILSGGPASVYAKESPKMDKQILNLKLPILGICYGHQLLAHSFKGKVKKGRKREYGRAVVEIKKNKDILKNLDVKEKVWMSHYDTVYEMPDDFEILASTKNCPIAAFKHKNAPIYGIQWHPEVKHTEKGEQILKNFIFNISKCKPNWKPTSLINDEIKKIRDIVNDKKAVIGLSGGIDSTTATMIAMKAIGQNLIAVFVDHGLMREGEPEFVRKIFTKLGVNVKIVDAKKRFIRKLIGIDDPEKKRKIIGEEFIRTFEEIAEKNKAEYLIQGTIYPDRIESGFKKHSETIKSHHNVAGLPKKIKFKEIIEPLKDLYKDEVRIIAKALGIPDSLVNRQPFPGPGLGVRIMGKITDEKASILRKTDKIFTEEIEKYKKLTKNLWQYFTVLTNTKSTGVKGDSRSYGYVLAIRAVESREAMTANFAHIPYKILEKISTRIINEVPDISRIVYDITHKPPATIEWE